jgi:ferredoxin
MRVIVDLSRCQGYANCVQSAPNIFDLDEDTDQAVVLKADPPAELHDAARNAALSCPAQAITIEGDEP